MATILLADDSPHAQRMGREILGSEGHQVVTVPDGAAAMSYLAENLPDVVLADVDMPGPSGFEICRYVKSTPGLDQVKVVLLRSPLEPFDAVAADQVRPDGVLAKPLDTKALVRTIGFLIAKKVLETSGTAEADSVTVERAPKHVAEAAGLRGQAPRETKSSLVTPADPKAASAPASGGAVSAPGTEPRQAPRRGLSQAEQRTRVRAAVSDIFEVLAPALIDSITDRVVEALREDPDSISSSNHGSKQL